MKTGRDLAALREKIAGQADCCEGIDLARHEIVSLRAGRAVSHYRECLESEGIVPKYFAGNVRERREGQIMGEVISPEEIRRKCAAPVVLISAGNTWTAGQVRRQMDNLQIKSLLADKLVFSRHCGEILEVFDMLEDGRSKYIYGNVLLARMEGAEISERFVTGHPYFCLEPFLKRSDSEVYADFGAAVGDSIEEYIWRKKNMFGKIYGFEPEPGNFEILTGRMGRLKREWGIPEGQIVLFQTEFGENRTVDSFFGDGKVNFMKADTGGGELAWLRGAGKTVARHRPVLAIGIYHTPSDMFRIPLEVKSMNPDYRLKIRHHSIGYAGTVLYAY